MTCSSCWVIRLNSAGPPSAMPAPATFEGTYIDTDDCHAGQTRSTSWFLKSEAMFAVKAGPETPPGIVRISPFGARIVQ
jgi:hypothetical protein